MKKAPRSKSKSKSNSKGKPTSTSVIADEVRFIIDRQAKPSLSNVKLTVEKSILYFGSNWRISFRDLHRGILPQMDHLLETCHSIDQNKNDHDTDTYYDALENHGYDENDDGEKELTFRSIDNKKKFHCTFHLPTASSSSTLPPSIRVREVQNFVSFFTRFQKLYDKWQARHFPHTSNNTITTDNNNNNNLRSYGRLASKNNNSYSSTNKRLSSLSTAEHNNEWNSKFKSKQNSYQPTTTSTYSHSSYASSRKQKTYGKYGTKRTHSALHRKSIGVFDDDDDYKYNTFGNRRDTGGSAVNDNNGMDVDADVDNGSSILEDDNDGNSHESVPDVCALGDNDAEVCAMGDESNGQQNDDDGNYDDEHYHDNGENGITKRRKRTKSAQRERDSVRGGSSTRRLKKLRTEKAPSNANCYDSDSDIDFNESLDRASDTITVRTISGNAIVDDDEDDNNSIDENKKCQLKNGRSNGGNDNDEDNRNDDDSDAIRPTNNADSDEGTKLTKHFFSKPNTVTVSPLYGSSIKKEEISLKKDTLSDPVTDDEQEQEEMKTGSSSNRERVNLSEKKASIENFFKVPSSVTSKNVANRTIGHDKKNNTDSFPSTPPRSDVPDLRGDTDSRTKRSSSSKYFSKSVQDKSLSLADRVLNLSPRKDSIVKKLALSPTRAPSDKEKSYFISEMQKSPNISKIMDNPYKSKTQETSRHIGLKNRGNTCYLNSSLQMIFSVPGFVSALKKIFQEVNQERGEKVDMPVTKAFLKVATDVNIIPPGRKTILAADPYDLKEAIDALTDKFAGYEQRDAHEFASALIDYIHDELMKVTKGRAVTLPTDEYFRLDVKVCLTCDSCKYTRCKEELYRHLSIELGKSEIEDRPWTVKQSLEQFFVPEVREIRCEKCNVGTTATQTIQVMSRPKALLLHLKRFIVNEATISFQKNRDRIICGKSISLDKFCDVSLKNKTKDCYNLRGVVRHIGGTASSGHYTADCERKSAKAEGTQIKGEWVAFNDGIAKSTELENVLQKNQRSAYMIMYGM